MKIDRAGFMRYNGGALKAAPKERVSYMIGIIGAMEIEVAGITAALTAHITETLCGVTFHTGKLNGTDVVAAKCGRGQSERGHVHGGDDPQLRAVRRHQHGRCGRHR